MNRSISIQSIRTPLGELIIGSFDGHLCLCDWKYRTARKSIDERISRGLDAKFEENHTDIITDTIKQLGEYLEGKRKKFDLPLLPVGTPFQKSVWEELQKIPYGETITYLDLSNRVSTEKTIRAVASANGANALSLFIPCHRVIGSKGELVGYAGGLSVKKKLLQIENPQRFPGQYELFPQG